MQKKTIAMMAVAGCMATLLSGCISQEEYDAKLKELDTAKQTIETLEGTVEDLEADVKKERSNARTATVKLVSAKDNEKILKAKEAVAVSALASEKATVSGLESELSAEKANVVTARKSADDAIADLAELQTAYKTLKARWTQIEANRKAINGASTPAKKSPAVAPAPKADSSALDMLNEMGSK